MSNVFTSEGRLDEDAIERLIKSGTVAQLQVARADLAAKQKHIEAQIASDKADARAELADAIAAGEDYLSAGLNSFTGTDHDWGVRAGNLLRLITAAIGRLNVRIAALHVRSMPVGAVVIPAAGRTSAAAAAALNILLQRGAKVMALGAIDGDLVVVASEPHGV